jgi:TPP-dependent pyruvate/acetoin dehydrogenase alpha subunit
MEPRLILSQVMARAGGYTGGKDNALHIGDLSHRVLPQISMLGASIPLAAGAALAARQRGENCVALTYIGDGGINTGDFHEGLNFAAALRLPLVLIVENNQFAYSTPVSKQTALEEIARRAVGYGIPGYQIDGNDVLQVYQTARQAVERARRGEGPTLIECVTMRMRGHSEHDDASYVPRELIDEWSARDPIVRFESWLASNGIMDSRSRDAIAAEGARQVESAAEWALQQPMPAGETAFEGVYSPSASRA